MLGFLNGCSNGSCSPSSSNDADTPATTNTERQSSIQKLKMARRSLDVATETWLQASNQAENSTHKELAVDLALETLALADAEEERLRAELTELQLQSQALQSQLSSLSAVIDIFTSAQAQCAALLIVADAVWRPLPPRGYAGVALLR